MDISEIITAFGAYYENSGQNMSRIRGLLTQGLVTPSICTPLLTDDTVYKMGQLSITSIVQSFQKGWTPKNAASITPNKIEKFRFKVDESIWPDDFYGTWLAFLTGLPEVDRAKWPLIRYIIEHPEQGYLAKINSDMELKEYGHGVYVEPTPGTASTTGAGMNGLIYLLQKGVDGGTMNYVDIETLDKTTIFDQVELFADGISEVYQMVDMDICMAPKWAKAYLRDKRVQGFYQNNSDKSIDLGIDFVPQKVRALPSLIGSDAIFATPKSNLIHLKDKTKSKTNIKIESYRREVSFFCDWAEGLGFGMDAAVWTNLPETVVGP